MKLNKLLLASCVLMASSWAAAGDADFTLKNTTGAQIDEVYISQHSSNNWGEDVMGSDSFGDGESIQVSFPHSGSACHFDIKVKYNDGDTAVWGNVDLCQYTKITLHWNSSKNETEAYGE